MADVIGGEHHEEIQPSPEQLDYEATQRHVAKLSKMAKEFWEKQKVTKDEAKSK